MGLLSSQGIASPQGGNGSQLGDPGWAVGGADTRSGKLGIPSARDRFAGLARPCSREVQQ